MNEQMKSYKHQKLEFDNHKDDEARALFWQMRTGKSKAVIDLAKHLYLESRIRGIFVVAPNGVHINWVQNELPKHMGFDYGAAAWISSAKKQSQQNVADVMQHPGIRWISVNMEIIIRDNVLNMYRDFITECDDRILLVVDESHHFGKPGSKRTRRIRMMARKADYRRILSGTAAEDSPLQLFSQFEILERGALGHTSLSSFASEYANTAKSVLKEAEEIIKCSG